MQLVLTCTYYDKFNSHINLHDAKTGLSLIRINLDNKFHKNLNGTIVKGPRVNIYDINEFSPSKRHFSYMKCYSLPYLIFDDSIDCVESLIKNLEFTNTKYGSDLQLRLKEM